MSILLEHLQQFLPASSTLTAGKLNKFIILYDKNDVTLDGKLKLSNTDKMVKKFQAMNFNVIECNGHNIRMIDEAFKHAKKCKDKPSVIIFKTIIGKDTELAGSNLSHGKVYSVEDIQALRKNVKREREVRKEKMLR